MSDGSCPHCGALAVTGDQFCTECGKALPDVSGGPRIVEGSGLAVTGAGQELQAAELHKKARGAWGALLAVAIIQTLGAIFIPMLLRDQGLIVQPIGYVILWGIAGAFYALAFWARYNPFPAAIVGLILFCSLHALEAVNDPSSLAKGIILKVIVIVVLIKAIQAGAQYRQLKQQMGAR